MKDEANLHEDTTPVRRAFDAEKFKSEYLLDDSIITLVSREDMKVFLWDHIQCDEFGGNTVRNSPQNAASLVDLHECLMEAGVHPFNLSIAVMVDGDIADFLEGRRPDEEQLTLEALCAVSPAWRARMLDGHHRRDAIVKFLEQPGCELSVLKVRVSWFRSGDDRSQFRQ